jgi:hypothetical protein
MEVELYLDSNCKSCDSYIESLRFWCDFFGHELFINTLDNDFEAILSFVKHLNDQGIPVDRFPFLVLGSSIQTGILSDDEVQSVISNYNG